MIRAVIFDLNGVIVRSPLLSDRFRDSFGVGDSEFLPALKQIMGKLRQPNAGDAFAHWKPFLAKWDVNLTKEQFYDFWFSAEKEDSGMIAIAEQLKRKGIRIFVLSNNFVERAAYYKKHFRFGKIFENIYYSFETGFVKPDKRAFEKLLKDNTLKAGECLYIDNQENNIETAKSIGIKTIYFAGDKELKKELEKISMV